MCARSSYCYEMQTSSGRDLVLFIYALYAIGFFTVVTPLIGAALAHLAYRSSVGIKRQQLRWQIKLFWYGALSLSAIGVLHLMVVGLGAVTAGVGLIFMILPWGLTLGWTLLSLWAIVRGAYAAFRGLPLTPSVF